MFNNKGRTYFDISFVVFITSNPCILVEKRLNLDANANEVQSVLNVLQLYLNLYS